MTALTDDLIDGIIQRITTKKAKKPRPDPWLKRREGTDRERTFRGRCPICRRNIARAKLGQVALEKLVRHGAKKGRRACRGSGMQPIR